MNKKMAFLLFSYPRSRNDKKGGAYEETYWKDPLLDRIATHFGTKYPGLEVTVARPSMKLSLMEEKAESVPYFFLPGVPSKGLSVMLFIVVSFFYLMTLRPSIVYSFSYGHTFPFLGAISYSKLARIPFFVDFRNPPTSLIPDPHRRPGRLERLFLEVTDRIVLGLTDRIIHINQRCKDLLKNSPKLYHKSLIAGDFARGIWFEDKAEVRHRSGKTDFACWGVIDEARELDVVIRGFANALTSSEEAKSSLYFMGDGNASEELKELAKELGVSEEVVFTGFLPQEKLVELLKKIDVAVVPIPPHELYQCSSPIKLVEAIVFELPILASDIEPNQVVENYNLGFLCGHTENDYKEAFLRFARYDDLRPFSRNCRELKHLFHPERAFEELDKEVRRALGMENRSNDSIH